MRIAASLGLERSLRLEILSQFNNLPIADESVSSCRTARSARASSTRTSISSAFVRLASALRSRGSGSIVLIGSGRFPTNRSDICCHPCRLCVPGPAAECPLMPGQSNEEGQHRDTHVSRTANQFSRETPATARSRPGLGLASRHEARGENGCRTDRGQTRRGRRWQVAGRPV